MSGARPLGADDSARRRGAGQRIVILGAGGTSVDFCEAALAGGCEVLGFLDDGSGSQEAGLRILGPLSLWKELPADVKFFLGIGSVASHRNRLDIVEKLTIPLERFATIVHPTAVVSPSARLEPGCGILGLSTLGAHAQLGAHVEVLQLCLVGHDCDLDDGVILAGAANLAGGVRVGCCSYIGAGASVRNGVRIGERSLLGMNSTLLQDMPSDAVYVGSPARPVARGAAERDRKGKG